MSGTNATEIELRNRAGQYLTSKDADYTLVGKNWTLPGITESWRSVDFLNGGILLSKIAYCGSIKQTFMITKDQIRADCSCKTNQTLPELLNFELEHIFATFSSSLISFWHANVS